MIVFSSHRGKAGSDARISSACEERYATVERWQVRVAACASPTAPCHVGVPCDLMLRGRTWCSTHYPFWLCVCQLDTFTPPWGLTLREGPVLNRVRAPNLASTRAASVQCAERAACDSRPWGRRAVGSFWRGWRGWSSFVAARGHGYRAQPSLCARCTCWKRMFLQALKSLSAGALSRATTSHPTGRFQLRFSGALAASLLCLFLSDHKRQRTLGFLLYDSARDNTEI